MIPMKRLSYIHTVAACHLGYVSQAVVNNFLPLLFLTFREQFSLSLKALSAIILVNFLTQLLTDLAAAPLLKKINYRVPVVAAHALIAGGLICLALLPGLIPPLPALCLSAMVYAVGGGLTEVLVSPIVEACPTKKKSSAMSLLHSSYCWGSALVILLSTGFFALFSVEKWRLLSCLWAILPLLNMLYFCFVPIGRLEGDTRENSPSLSRRGKFAVFFLLMLSAGAAELAVSQWASAFAESGLGLDKAAGDLLGPCLFALLMGSARIVQALMGGKIDSRLYLLLSSVLLLGGYLLTALGGAVAAVCGCGLCGFAVGALWPGVFSLASEELKGGGSMFALLAFAGDLGCGLGPALVGAVAGGAGDDLAAGLFAATVFPLLLCILLSALLFSSQRKRRQQTPSKR